MGIRTGIAGFLIGISVINSTAYAFELPRAGEARFLSEFCLPEAGVAKVFSGRLIFEKKEESDNYLLAKIAMAEAEGEDITGKALVIRVVLNRLESEKFPDSVKDIIFEDKQFASITDGRWDRVEPNKECWKAVELVKNGWDESEDAVFFERTDLSDSWQSKNLKLALTHQNHNFYRR